MKRSVIIIIIVVAILSGYAFYSDYKRKQAEKTGDEAGSFTLINYNGETVSLSDYIGKKPVFINFWAAWCPFCVEELPLMGRIQDKFGDEYVTLAVNRAEDPIKAKEFTDGLGVSDKMIFLLDPDDSVYREYGGFSMPYSVFIDKNGVIIDKKLGPLTEQELEEKILKILSQ